MQSYMEGKGYSWIFQVDAAAGDDDDDQKPLLEELEIDLDDIYAKVADTPLDACLRLLLGSSRLTMQWWW